MALAWIPPYSRSAALMLCRATSDDRRAAVAAWSAHPEGLASVERVRGLRGEVSSMVDACCGHVGSSAGDAGGDGRDTECWMEAGFRNPPR